MPGWHARTRKLQEEGKLQLVGVIQEQHAERCLLFKQWQGFQWPILVDSLNLHGLPSIPFAMAVDEHGILRHSRLRPGADLEEFLSTEFPAPAKKPLPRRLDDLDGLRESADKAPSTANLMNLGSGEFLFGGQAGTTRAIAAFERVVKAAPAHAQAWFRLGVAYRARLDDRHTDVRDFERASRAWSRALGLNPGQYIWRRRIQQFGPRMDKPYNFYRWITEAVAAIKKRGEKPVALRTPLTASEKMQRDDKAESRSDKNPDPDKLVANDKSRLVMLSRAVVPARVDAGRSARLHVLLVPNRKLRSHWDRAAGPVTLWVEGFEEWQRAGAAVSSSEILGTRSARSLEIEITVPKNTKPGTHTLRGFALYPVCEDAEGTCQFLRQEFEVSFETTPARKRRR